MTLVARNREAGEQAPLEEQKHCCDNTGVGVSVHVSYVSSTLCCS